MINKVFDIRLDSKQDKTLRELVRVTQSDNASNVLNVRIFDGEQEINYSSVATPRIAFAKPDRTTVQGTLLPAAKGYAYTMGTNEIAAVGITMVAIVLYGPGNERLTTCRFSMRVDSDMLPAGAIESTTQLDALSQLMAQLEAQAADLDQLINSTDAVNLQSQIDALDAATAALGVSVADKLSLSGGVLAGPLNLPTGRAMGQQDVSNPNLLINGDFSVWQRGDTITSPGGIVYTADRWAANYSTIVVSKIANTSPGNAQNVLRAQVNLSSGTNVVVAQRIEYYANLNSQKVTISFYARCLKGTLPIRASVFGVASEVSTATTTWQKFSHTFVLPATVSNGIVYITTTATQSDTAQGIELACVKLEVGDKATPFVPRLPGEELALCQRYFQTSDPATWPERFMVPVQYSTRIEPIRFIRDMRAIPTIVFPDGGATLWGGTAGDISILLYNVTNKVFFIRRPDGLYFNANTIYYFRWTADAEIY